jgi:hypothetical protein
MAYHKHPDVQHAMRWVEVMLQEPGCCKADVESLRNGVIFCRVADSLLEHCVDLSQVRKQGNLETVCLHNLALLNKSLQRYKIKIPSKLQVSQTDHALARTGTHWLVHDQHILQAAFESIGQKRSSTQHIVNLLMCGACASLYINARGPAARAAGIRPNVLCVVRWIFEYFTGSKSGQSPTDLGVFCCCGPQ